MDNKSFVTLPDGPYQSFQTLFSAKKDIKVDLPYISILINDFLDINRVIGFGHLTLNLFPTQPNTIISENIPFFSEESLLAHPMKVFSMILTTYLE